MPWENVGNTVGEGIKLATAPRHGNLIADNPSEAVGRITNRITKNKYI